MKNIFLSLLAPISISIAMSGSVYAQALEDSTLMSFSHNKRILSREEINRTADSGFHYLNEMNLRVVRAFMEEFTDVYNVKWVKSEKGYIALFVKDSIDTRVHYDNRGVIEVQFRYYLENRLLPEIRALVKRRYYDYHIIQVSEARKGGVTCHQVKIRKKNQYKVVNIINGEMKIMDEFSEAAPR